MTIPSDLHGTVALENQPSQFDYLLVSRCLRRDDAAWGTMVKAYSRLISSYCRRFSGCREDVDDLTQEVLIRIYRNLHSFRAESGSFHGWVLSLSRNLIIDRYRHAKRFKKLGGSVELEQMHLEDRIRPNPQRSMEQVEASLMLHRALRALSPGTRKAIILRELQGLAYQEIAESLGVPEGTIKSRVNRGRLTLARELTRQTSRPDAQVENRRNPRRKP